MSHRLYLYNLAEVGNPDGDCLGLMEWGYELPAMLLPLLGSAAFVAANCYNDAGSEEGLYAEAPAGIQALRDFYDFIERHAGGLLDDVEAFRRARQRIFQLLDERALHPWFHLDAWDVFNMSDEDHGEQAHALLEAIGRGNAAIRLAIANDNPTLLDDCLESSWAPDFRTLLNHANYDYGWEPLGALLPQHDGDVEIFGRDGHCGLRGPDGQVLVEPRYQSIYDFDWASGLAVAVREGRFGYLDQQGREVIPCRFDDAYDFSGDHALVGMAGHLGLIDRHGELRVPCQFQAGEPLGHEGQFWAVQQNDLWGVIDNRGAWKLPAQYGEIHDHGGCYQAKPPKGRAQLFTTSFHDLGALALDDLECQFLSEAEGSCYLLRRREGKQWRYRALDTHGEALLPGEYQALKYLHSLQAWLVREQGLYGLYCHRKQAYLLPCRYRALIPQDNPSRDDDGSHYCLVQDDTGWGLYRGGPNPGWSIEPHFERLHYLDAACFACRQDDRWGIVDKLGRWLRDRLDELPPTTHYRPADCLALAFRGQRAFRVQADGTAEPLAAAEALRIVERYGQYGLSDEQLACLHGSAGDLWLARETYRKGLAAYDAGQYERARPLFEQALALGEEHAANELGCLLQNQAGDPTAALAYYQRAAAAGSAVAARNAGNCHAEGLGTAVDPAQARHYLELAVQGGHHPAHLELAELLVREAPPVGDHALALDHFQAAWRQGQKDASAVYLGWLYEQREDYAQAFRHYRHAAGVDDSYAHWRLGGLYQQGLGCKADPHLALEHWQQAAERGQPDACLDLARFHFEQGDPQRAAPWLEKALAAQAEGALELAEQWRS